MLPETILSYLCDANARINRRIFNLKATPIVLFYKFSYCQLYSQTSQQCMFLLVGNNHFQVIVTKKYQSQTCCSYQSNEGDKCLELLLLHFLIFCDANKLAYIQEIFSNPDATQPCFLYSSKSIPSCSFLQS